jgi:hypothetical protein
MLSQVACPACKKLFPEKLVDCKTLSGKNLLTEIASNTQEMLCAQPVLNDSDTG